MSEACRDCIFQLASVDCVLDGLVGIFLIGEAVAGGSVEDNRAFKCRVDLVVNCDKIYMLTICSFEESMTGHIGPCREKSHSEIRSQVSTLHEGQVSHLHKCRFVWEGAQTSNNRKAGVRVRIRVS